MLVICLVDIMILNLIKVKFLAGKLPPWPPPPPSPHWMKPWCTCEPYTSSGLLDGGNPYLLGGWQSFRIIP